MSNLLFVSNPEHGMGFWVSVSVILLLILLLIIKGKFKTEVTEIVEIENKIDLPCKEGKNELTSAPNTETFGGDPIYLVGYYADIKFKINGALKTINRVHSFTKIYVGRKIEINYFIFFKFKINYGENLLT